MKRTLETILHDDIQRIFDHFAAAFGIAIVFYSIDGKIVKRGLSGSGAHFCALIQNQLFSRKRCAYSDEQMCRRCTRSRRMVSYRCHAGIEEAVAPLYVGQQLAGYAMIGQFRTSDVIQPEVLAMARRKGLRVQLQDAFRQLPCFSRERADHILGLFSVLADYIVTKEMIAVKAERSTERILRFVEEHLHESVSVRDAAVVTGQSVSTVSHQLKRATGKTFTRHLNEARIRRAEEYLRQSPGLSVQDAAARVGFNDPFYFSRVYRKLRGFPPRRCKP